MAVAHHPEYAAESQRLISVGGNIYSLATGYVKTGNATRGRGFWAGRKRDELADPDVDNPGHEGAETLIPVDEEDDGFDDDKDPVLSMHRKLDTTIVSKQQLKASRQIAEAVYGARMTKAILSLGSVKVDLILKNPEELSEEELLRSASTVSWMIDQASGYNERELLQHHAARIAKALRDVLTSRQAVKALLTRSAEDKEKPVKEAKKPPAKAQTTQVNDKGKVAYKYPKSGDGKGPNSDGWKGKPKAKGGDQEPPPEEQASTPPITPPQPIDPTPFAKMLGVGPGQLERFAARKTKEQFVDFFMKQTELVQKHHLNAPMLAKLYDALVSPPPPAPQMQSPQPPQPTAIVNQPAQKSIVVFNGATLDRKTLALIDMLKSYKAETVSDIRKCFQTHFACTEDAAFRMTLATLNKWERQGLVSFYPAK